MKSAHEVIIYYKYTPVSDPAACVRWMRALCERLGINGRILIAKEGINGTVEGTPEQIATYTTAVHACPHANFSDIWFKSSPGTGKAFQKLIVKARKEIVTTGLPEADDINPNEITGTHIEPATLKEWIERGEVEIVDMRNDYEYAVGHFDGSHASGMANFRDLAAVAPALSHLKEKKVVTVCTYGVRCEKASGYLKQQGFKDVYQLNGGIGSYMKAYPGEDFLGSLYVFDTRMTEQFTDAYKVIGTCVACNATSERFGNCAWSDCHKQLIICEACSNTPTYCTDVCRKSC
jgi:UPF0176 protein